ncbi:MAG: lipopolysaccharide kinase InaA family protein [Sulfurimonas sp.]|nr:lipopolysaccharide kinase InaA family protein [Sulfurimonas sp.]
MSHKLLLNPQYKNFEDDLLNIKEIFKGSDASIHKARNELKIVELHGIKCVVKSFKVPHIVNRVAYTHFREGKAKKSYLNAMKLQELGVNTPEAIGIIEFFENGLLAESYFISVMEKNDFTIREVFHHTVSTYADILKDFAKFTYEIHQKGVWHVDYSLGNILVTVEDEGFKFSLVDINRMEFRTISPYEGLTNFNKFWAKDDNDLVILATEYANLAGIDVKKAIDIVIHEAKFLEAKVNLKRRLKGKK